MRGSESRSSAGWLWTATPDESSSPSRRGRGRGRAERLGVSAASGQARCLRASRGNLIGIRSTCQPVASRSIAGRHDRLATTLGRPGFSRLASAPAGAVCGGSGSARSSHWVSTSSDRSGDPATSTVTRVGSVSSTGPSSTIFRPPAAGARGGLRRWNRLRQRTGRQHENTLATSRTAQGLIAFGPLAPHPVPLGTGHAEILDAGNRRRRNGIEETASPAQQIQEPPLPADLLARLTRVWDIPGAVPLGGLKR